MRDHDCTGAECPLCAPFPAGRLAARLIRPTGVWGTPGAAGTKTGGEGAEAPADTIQCVDPRCVTFRDSRGLPVRRMPTQLAPSATIIIRGQPAPLRAAWQIVIQQREDNGWWGMPGGRMEIGESIVACARREALEETGIQVDALHLVCVDSDPSEYAICVYPHGALVQYCNLTFVASVCGQPQVHRSEESRQVCWAWTDALPARFLPSHRWRLEQAMAQREGVIVR